METVLLIHAVGLLIFESVYCGDAPVVAPFMFPPALKEGERGSATCTIRSGDRPVEFNWKKDGRDLTVSSSVDIQSFKDSSFLVIESVTSESSGNYTCIVSNTYGRDQFTASLTVTAPPQWLKEPMDSISQEGENLIIECEASGVPSPTIKWITRTANDVIPKDASSPIRVTETGSLIISKVDATMQGSYTCEAENGFGDPLKKEVLIAVRDAPVVAPFIFPPALREGERGSAICTIRSGDRPVEFQWKKDGEILEKDSNVDIQSLKDSSFLIIESVTSKSSGNYSCTVTNTYGRDEYTSSLTVTGDKNVVISNDPSSPIRVTSTGSLVINKVDALMKGTYICEAENGFGNPLRKEIFISVRDAPVVVPFSFPSALKEGERGSSICTIRSGDRPLEFQWLKDGENVISNKNVDIQSVKDTSSILSIESVTSQSSGNYTCIVRNAFGSDRYTANLAVSAPPIWSYEPMDIIAKEGDSVSIKCQATGVPQPAITWTTYKIINERSHLLMHFLIDRGKIENTSELSALVRYDTSGTLHISKVDSSLKGSYSCIADNGFGTALQKKINIAVQGEKCLLLDMEYKVC
ncbi:Down syndrome cell adhesion molecule-like protein 1 [Araneus ventricosus]|uniref:Down syndrome cell adhesion molecule-like protein 1 n=1 Tax=Araneus ventricosus TaxID=182803 RepID=A0A4Y2A9Z0_ARAVE|nr:Down syndrome cell adhesion molecule-like protein 1 [Araneus ventricosus]